MQPEQKGERSNDIRFVNDLLCLHLRHDVRSRLGMEARMTWWQHVLAIWLLFNMALVAVRLR
jgi:hypothetical protein